MTVASVRHALAIFSGNCKDNRIKLFEMALVLLSEEKRVYCR